MRLEKPSQRQNRGGLRAVALFEATKGVIVVLTGLGFWVLLHGDLQLAGERIVERLHLNPAHRIPRIFTQALRAMSEAELRLLATGALCYALLRFVEAYGLWREHRWATWLAALSGAIYVPLECYELSLGFGFLKLGSLLVNLFVVGYMSRVLWRTRNSSQEQR